MRGINLGCGKVILPCERPEHHVLVPEWVYTDTSIQWDNVDWNTAPGVNRMVDLFDYPWREKQIVPGDSAKAAGVKLPDNTYDVAVASHIAEHIPHHIIWEGQFVHHHPDYQDGFFAFFAELYRIMKPGGKAYILCPFAFSNGAMADPTHTRYLLPATFNYFHAAENGSPFEYRTGARWKVNLKEFNFRPHEEVMNFIQRHAMLVNGLASTFRLIEDQPIFTLENLDFGRLTNELSVLYLNAIADFCVEMTAVKDESVGAVPEPERRSEAVPEPARVDAASGADGGAQGVVRSGATS